MKKSHPPHTHTHILNPSNILGAFPRGRVDRTNPLRQQDPPLKRSNLGTPARKESQHNLPGCPRSYHPPFTSSTCRCWNCCISFIRTACEKWASQHPKRCGCPSYVLKERNANKHLPPICGRTSLRMPLKCAAKSPARRKPSSHSLPAILAWLPFHGLPVSHQGLNCPVLLTSHALKLALSPICTR